MPLHVNSPYGLDVAAELSTLFGVQGLEAFSKAVQTHLELTYGFASVSLQRLHLAGAFALTVHADDRLYVYKLDDHEDEGALETLLQRVETLRLEGLPFPHVHQTRRGNWFSSPFLESSWKGSLISLLTGEPVARWSAHHADATAYCLAAMHRLGRDQPVQPGERTSFGLRWPEALEAAARLGASGVVPEAALAPALELLTAGPPEDGLLWTHIHGDARLCHFLFSGDNLTGLIDHDAGMWGQRLLDVAFHLISHPDHAKIAFLSLNDIRHWLGRYHSYFPLSDAERRALPAGLTCALLTEMGETLMNLEAGTPGVKAADLTAGVRLLDALCSEGPTLLGVTGEPRTAPR